jgi:hypothetical protein
LKRPVQCRNARDDGTDLGTGSLQTAAVTIRGIELAEKIKKQQFNLELLTGQPTTAPAIWTALLAA